MNTIESVPVRYRGTLFASTLEADWAATFDRLGWYWQYEPLAVRLLNGECYRPDFCLPAQRVWCEVKGPHDERLHKTRLLQATLSYDRWDWESWLVVVLRPPGPGEAATWHGTSEEQDIVLVRCFECGHYCFMDHAGIWTCRHHIGVGTTPEKPWRNGGELLRSGDAMFTRAPRLLKRGA
ncbi:hypothetical protein FHU38_000958 [Saccharomonospora amisosensis]|uniref:Uncharacterized protein n=1 Tax=Saccharomonospora amisosensis TaxID=1128677 RepID=A0A7X5ZPD8_9PSEU|nr:hypothetical protein [Saccharomonospora amisosensis]NIJ10614.1 hypothetical protein [Saccharomonospora amisosensis]